MRIKRFNENDQISKERVDEVVKDLKEFSSVLDSRLKGIVSLIDELGRYAGEKGEIDEIDDSISALRLARQDIESSLGKIDDAVAGLEKYNPFLLL